MYLRVFERIFSNKADGNKRMEKYTMKGFIICTLHHILLECSVQEG
jgi:hypothetical protein